MTMRRVLCAMAVFVAAVLPFARSVRHDIVNLDDYDYVEREMVTRGLTRQSVTAAFSDGSQHIWMPLTWVSYMACEDVARVAGLPPHGVQHGMNVALHGLNAVLLWVLFLRLFPGKRFMAFVAVLFWAVHPLRCEPVCWLASRKDVLSMSFLLCALLGWLRFRRCGRVGLSYAVTMGLFLAALAAKPSAMVFPVLAMLLDVFRLPRFSELQGTGEEMRRILRICLPYLVPCVISGVAAVSAKHLQDFGFSVFREPTQSWRCLNAFNSLGVYVWHTLLPINLAVQCTNRFPQWPRLCCVAMPLAAGLFFMFLKLKFKTPMGLFWYVVSVFPTLGIVGFGYHAFADRFTYLPAIGFSFVLLTLPAGMERIGKHDLKKTMRLILPALIAGLTVLSYRQTGFWKDDYVLFTHTLEVDGDRNFTAHGNLAMYHWEFTHDLERCLYHLEKAQAAEPVNFHYSYLNLMIMAASELNRPQRVTRFFSEAGKAERETKGEAVSSAGYLCARGVLDLKLSDRQDARECLEILERDTPKDLNTLYLAAALAEYDGRKDVAEAKRNEIRKTRPSRSPDYMRFRFL